MIKVSLETFVYKGSLIPKLVVSWSKKVIGNLEKMTSPRDQTTTNLSLAVVNTQGQTLDTPRDLNAAPALESQPNLGALQPDLGVSLPNLGDAPKGPKNGSANTELSDSAVPPPS